MTFLVGVVIDLGIGSNSRTENANATDDRRGEGMNMSMICALALIMAPAIVTADPQPAAPAPEAVVQAQVEAYNARNIDAFLATYTDDVQVFEHPGKLLVSGATQMRERYTARFKEPNLHATILKRIVMGNYVIDHERVRRTFDDGTGTLDAVAIFEVQGTKIARVWLISGPKALDAK